MAKENFTFQTEVGKLLDIVAHSLYSHKEIFLRELVSNASDACDKLRYAALTKPKLIEGGGDFKIVLSVDKKARTLSISDNGIGMDRDDLVEMIGTIANSGTMAFVEKMSGDKEKDMALIGQFGVGFYSSFMVADKVEVLSRKAGSDQAWLWTSDGKGEFTIEEAVREERGATVILHLSKKESEFLEDVRLKTIIKTHSDHIPVSIVLAKDDAEEESLNEASALWTRQKKDITDQQYKEFYQHVGHMFDEPWAVMHNRVEGILSYTSLLFIPSTAPFDLFQPDRSSAIKLYVNKVFITDKCEGLIPSYLRFLRGVVDSEDLSLNISREMLQNDPKLAKIQSRLVKRVFSELKKKAEKTPEDYEVFWEAFGAVLKEGVYEDFANRETILELCRFRSTNGEGLSDLGSYVGRMKDGQDAIYYITGQDFEQVSASPQLEGFRAKGIEVLLLTDPVDEFWLPSAGNYQEKPFKSITQGITDLDKLADKDAEDEKSAKKKPPAGMDQLIAFFKTTLEGSVKDVRVSERLTDSSVCLVAGEGDMDMNLERLLKQHGRVEAKMASLRILELNPQHALIKRLAKRAKDEKKNTAELADAARLLLDQALIIEGEGVGDPVAFSKRLSGVMAKGLA
jgi:molecular chaperone HtpG